MLVVAGTITFDPTHTEGAKAAAAKVMAATRAEPGNVEYAFSIDMADPSIVRVFEVWDDQAALDAHFELPHVAEFTAAIAGFGVQGMDIVKYEVASSGPLR